MPPAPATSDMLAEMSACAYRLGMAFGRAAERAQAAERQVALYQLFDRCFFAVRVATALQLRLRREGAMSLAHEPDGEAEVLEDPAERERREPADGDPGRERFEADRDREREPASLPVLFKTLQGVAADASTLPGPKPAELPTLQDLLARATGAPPQAPAAKPTVPLRDRLAGSAAVAAATLAPETRPSPRLPARRATGPPER